MPIYSSRVGLEKCCKMKLHVYQHCTNLARRYRRVRTFQNVGYSSTSGALHLPAPHLLFGSQVKRRYPQNEVPGHRGAYTQTHPHLLRAIPVHARRKRISETPIHTYVSPPTRSPTFRVSSQEKGTSKKRGTGPRRCVYAHPRTHPPNPSRSKKQL